MWERQSGCLIASQSDTSVGMWEGAKPGEHYIRCGRSYQVRTGIHPS